MPPSLTKLARHIFYESSVKLIQVEADRRMVKRLRRERPSSFPFVSADTFRALADTVIEGTTVLRRHQTNRGRIIFMDMSGFRGGENSFAESPSLRNLHNELQLEGSKPTVVMHNGDKLPSEQLLLQIKDLSDHLFASNLLDEDSRTTALPVGLENVYRNENGLLEEFVAFRDSSQLEDRLYPVFSAFNVATNKGVREPLRDELRVSRFGWLPKRMSRSEYRDRIRHTMFVLSPPGNGVDCHRTWEAIYLGAVPVVLEGSLAPSLISNLPILAVKSFSELLRRSDSELRETYLSLVSRSWERALMPYWIRRITNSSADASGWGSLSD